MDTDQVFEKPTTRGSFRFNDEVAGVFDNMASRSIPFYQDIIHLSSKVIERFAQDGTSVYDLGCSTCSLLILSAKKLAERDVKLIGYDPSESMRRKAQEKLDVYTYSHGIELRDGVCQTANLENASVVILNYTLQFVPSEDRAEVIQRIYDSLVPGGILILSEKIAFDDNFVADYCTDLYMDLKRENGYSELEISNKREALEDILVPWTLDKNLTVLKESGFGHCETIFKWSNFCTIIAHK